MIGCSGCEKDFTDRHVVRWGENKDGMPLHWCGSCLIWHNKNELVEAHGLLRAKERTAEAMETRRLVDEAARRQIQTGP